MDQPRSLSVLTVALAFAYGVARIVEARVPAAALVCQIAQDVLALALALAPAAWGRAPVPAVEPPRIADAVRPA